MKRTTSKFLSLTLSLALTCGLCAPQALASGSGFDDTAGHWAEKAIDRWSGYGIVQGYDGHFDPDGTLTRGQMAAVLSNTLGLTDTAENPFTDVDAGAWYAPYVLRCYAAGVMEGDGANAHPDTEITRQETMVMLCRALGIAPAETPDLSNFTDGDTVADWAAPYVAALTASGIVGGVGDGQLAPMGDMTRASLLTVLDRSIVQYINAPGTYELADQEGLILVAAGDVTLTGKTAASLLVTPAAQGKALTFDKAQVTGAVTVQADKLTVTAKDSTLPEIKGVEVKTETTKPTTSKGGGSGGGGDSGPVTPTVNDLSVTEAKTVEAGTYKNVTITAAVADGEVTLSGLTIQGDLTINGGGSSSIKLVNCTVGGKVVLDKASGQPPRLYLTNTPLARVETAKPAIIEAADGTSAVTTVEAKAKVEVRGESTAITSLTVPAGVEAAVEVAVTAGTVSKVEAQGETTIKGDVAAVTAQAPVTIESGTVAKVEVPATVGEAVTVTVDAAAAVNHIEAKGEASVTATGTVGTVTAEQSVTIASGTVEKVEVPSTAAQGVTVDVASGATVSDVAVNAPGGAAITGEGTVTNVSSELPEAPTITVNGTPVTHIHKWGEGVETQAPTCTVAGTVTYTCTAEGCAETPASKAETIPALGHTVVIDPAVAATCTEDGKTQGKHCSVCNEVLTAQEPVPALGHAWGNWTAEGENHTRVCANDASHTETKPHTEVTDQAVAATCTEAGKTEGKHCSDCHAVLTAQEAVPALGHDFTGAYQTDASGHWHQCSCCDATDEKAAHTFDAADCDQVTNCTVCQYQKPAGQHNYGEPVVTKAATCTEAGSQKEVCGICGKEAVTELPALGHDYAADFAVDKAATCTEAGSKSKHCSRCDSTTDVTAIPQLDHTWGAWASVDETNHKRTCSVCNTEDTEAHAWDEGEVTKEPTESETGVKTFTCTVCGDTKTEILPVVTASTIKWSEDKLGTLTWDAVDGASKYKIRVLINGEVAATTNVTETSYNVSTHLLKFVGSTSESFDVQVSALGSDNKVVKELGTLEKSIDVTVTGSAVMYSFEVTGEKSYNLTLDSTTPNGKRMWTWTDTTGNNSDFRANGSTSTQQYEYQNESRYYSFQEGDTIDVRVITSERTTNSVYSVTITPVSSKTYTVPTGE